MTLLYIGKRIAFLLLIRQIRHFFSINIQMGEFVILIRLIPHSVIVIPVYTLGFHLHLTAQHLGLHLKDRFLFKVSIKLWRSLTLLKGVFFCPVF